MKQRFRRHSFTLIEMLVVIALIAIVAGGTVLGIARSIKATQLKISRERVERMLLQAFRFAAISGHVADVVLSQKEDGSFEGYIDLWGTDSKDLPFLARNCASIGSLSGIQSICLNDRPVDKAIFRFFGGHGLSIVDAYDSSHRQLSPEEFGFSSETARQKSRELEITLQTDGNSESQARISLELYLLSEARYLPFPDDCLTNNV